MPEDKKPEENKPAAPAKPGDTPETDVGVSSPGPMDDAPNSQANAPMEELKIDKTIPGGRYIVAGQLVDANGQPIKE